jgi:branched-subunit amino acid aminotransferase/4-amino-4-deoxychorismate lyase
MTPQEFHDWRLGIDRAAQKDLTRQQRKAQRARMRTAEQQFALNALKIVIPVTLLILVAWLGLIFGWFE